MRNETPASGVPRRDLFRLAAAVALAPSVLSASDAHQRSRNTYAYGSGYFGEWILDEHGAPAYRYTCDQLTDSKAAAPTDPIFCGPTDQWHQLGNDRLVAKASNFGYVQVRQDEGAPKFLNDYIPTEGEFGGGLGFLSNGNCLISTYHTGAANRFDRIFGLGYYRKTVTAEGYTIDQTIFAPFGDDPVLLTEVKVRRHAAVRNSDARRATLRWTEYWGCRPYEFFGGGPDVCTQTETHLLRRIFAKRFKHTFELLDGGLLERKTYTHDPHEYPAGPGGRRSRDVAPPSTFCVPLGGEPASITADSFPFFRHGGIARPEAAKVPGLRLLGSLRITIVRRSEPKHGK